MLEAMRLGAPSIMPRTFSPRVPCSTRDAPDTFEVTIKAVGFHGRGQCGEAFGRERIHALGAIHLREREPDLAVTRIGEAGIAPR